MKADFHVHTTYSDGAQAPEEMIQTALNMGITHLGFSDHSFTRYDTSCCIPESVIPAYRAEIERLKVKYSGRIKIYCGLEQDIDSPLPQAEFDYLIGSVHSLCVQGRWFPVDWKREHIESLCELMGGDIYRVAEAYYDRVGQVAEQTHCDLIGHFDLIAKLNDRCRFFDEGHPRYVSAWQRAADELLKADIPFEINTGAMARGYRSQPYPSGEIVAYLARQGARFVLSSDCHDKKYLLWSFEKVKPWAEELGGRVIDWQPQHTER